MQFADTFKKKLKDVFKRKVYDLKKLKKKKINQNMRGVWKLKTILFS